MNAAHLQAALDAEPPRRPRGARVLGYDIETQAYAIRRGAHVQALGEVSPEGIKALRPDAVVTFGPEPLQVPMRVRVTHVSFDTPSQAPGQSRLLGELAAELDERLSLAAALSAGAFVDPQQALVLPEIPTKAQWRALAVSFSARPDEPIEYDNRGIF